MATGTELFNNLDQRSKDISNALDELNNVIAGDDGSGFDRTEIWPTDDVPDVNVHITDLEAFMGGLRVIDGVENAIDTLFEGLPVGDAIMSASEEVKKFMQQVNTEVQNLKNTANLGGRITAFQQLNNPASGGGRGVPNYGYVPAVLGVINAAADTNLNSQPVTDALNKIEGVLNDVDSYNVFAAYVAASTVLLLKSLAVGQVSNTDDR